MIFEKFEKKTFRNQLEDILLGKACVTKKKHKIKCAGMSMVLGKWIK